MRKQQMCTALSTANVQNTSQRGRNELHVLDIHRADKSLNCLLSRLPVQKTKPGQVGARQKGTTLLPDFLF